jgi:DNA-directed RNA polymerase subunit F
MKMYQIEKLGKSYFYIKAIGDFPPSVAKKFVAEFKDLTHDIKEDLRVIVDISDAILLNIRSIELILDLLKENNQKLYKSAFIISINPPLDTEFKYLFEKAETDKRKIVHSLAEAKDWIEIKHIIIKK